MQRKVYMANQISILLSFILLLVCFYMAYSTSSDNFFNIFRTNCVSTDNHIVQESSLSIEEVSALTVNQLSPKGFARTTQLKVMLHLLGVYLILAVLPIVPNVLKRMTMIAAVCSTSCNKVIISYLHQQDGFIA